MKKFIFKKGNNDYVHIEHTSKRGAIQLFKQMYPNAPVQIISTQILIK